MLDRDYKLIIDANLLQPYNKWPLEEWIENEEVK